MPRYSKDFTYRGQAYRAQFIKRPFREGLEVSVSLPSGRKLRIGELGLGERALLERVCQELDKFAPPPAASNGCSPSIIADATSSNPAGPLS